jgi:acetoacetyl-CoA synthetase
VTDDSAPIWTPTPDDIARANLTRFVRELPALLSGTPFDVPSGLRADDIAPLWRWSVEHRRAFWTALWRFADVQADGASDRPAWANPGIGLDRMAPPDPVEGPRWFPEARLNFAEHLLRRRDDHAAIVAWDETGERRRLTHAHLAGEVARVQRALREWGVQPGDVVAGWMPNIPETIVAMLAAASLGATWTSCSPDFGVQGVLDRFGQVRPVVLFAADGYRYAGKAIDCRPKLRQIVEALPSVRRVVLVPWLEEAPTAPDVRDVVAWHAPPAADAAPTFVRLPFDHPLYVLYSSGTTGLPKAIVHGAGGTLLQHLKELVLHTDLRSDDAIFYFTTCGWMMWNWLVSALAVGSTVVLYDGAPLAPDPAILWRLAEAERVAVFGTSAKYLALADKAGLVPARTHRLDALRAILSTGSPLAPTSYDYVASSVKPGVRVSSISGGTDIVSCFALGNPCGPVWRGELQTRGLGMAVDVWTESGAPVRGEAGELVCTQPFPSMPVGFWNDPDGAKYRAAYFEHFPGVWRHGDWAELTADDGLIIHGRSDATLNPGGVRIGTAEIYRQVETLPEIVESLVVGQDVRDGAETDVRIVLFVRMADGAVLDDALRDTIRRRIREGASPHHVPKVIVAVADIPRTISGKITELAVRDVIHGRWPKNVEALANPQALELYRDLPELRA